MFLINLMKRAIFSTDLVDYDLSRPLNLKVGDLEFENVYNIQAQGDGILSFNTVEVRTEYGMTFLEEALLIFKVNVGEKIMFRHYNRNIDDEYKSYSLKDIFGTADEGDIDSDFEEDIMNLNCEDCEYYDSCSQLDDEDTEDTENYDPFDNDEDTEDYKQLDNEELERFFNES